MQPECPHEQAVTRVLSLVSQSVLQCLPDVVTHEQAGFAHFSPVAVAISFLLVVDQQRVIHNEIVDTGFEYFCSEKNTCQIGPWNTSNADTCGEVLASM